MLIRISDTIKNIFRNWMAFLAIVITVALGVSSYLGIYYAASAVSKGAASYYKKTAYRDFELRASLLMSDKDLDAIKEINGVSDAEGVYQTTGFVEKQPVEIISRTDRVNIPLIKEGALPGKKNECAVEPDLGCKVGDKISVKSANGKKALYMSAAKYKVVGIVSHPDHISKRIKSDPYVIVTEDAFDKKALDNHFMKAMIRLDGVDATDTFSDSYFKTVSSAGDSLEDLAVVRAAARDDEIYEQGMGYINTVKSGLDKDKSNLDKDRKSLDKTEKNLRKEKENLNRTKENLEHEQDDLNSQKQKLDERAADLEKRKSDLDETLRKLDESAQKVAEEYDAVASRKNDIRKRARQLIDKYLPDKDKQAIKWTGDEGRPDRDSINSSEYNALRLSMTANYSADSIGNVTFDALIRNTFLQQGIVSQDVEKYMSSVMPDPTYSNSLEPYNSAINSCNEWNEKHVKYLQEYQSYQDRTKEYEDLKKRYDEDLAAFNRSQEDHNNRQNEYANSDADYKNRKKSANNSEKNYANREREYQNGLNDVADMQDALDNMEDAKWINYTRHANPSFEDIYMVSSDISSLGLTVSVLFLLMAVVICAASTGRIFEQQKRQIGTVLAMGMYRREVYPKFYFFGLLSVGLGMLIGALTGYSVIQTVITESMESLYTIGNIHLDVLPVRTAVVCLIGILAAIAAVFVAAFRIRRKTAGELLSNDFETSDMKSRRVIASVCAIAGGAAMIVVGFTIKFSIDTVISREYNDIIKYTYDVNYNLDVSARAQDEILAILEDEGLSGYSIFSENISYKIDGRYDTAELMAVPDDKIKSYITLGGTLGSEELSVDDSGLLIQSRLAETYGLKAGDNITIYNSEGAEREARISGIFLNYIGREMITSQAYYKSLYGDEVSNNRFLTRSVYGSSANIDEKALAERLDKVDGFISIQRKDREAALFRSVSYSMFALNIIIIIIAAIIDFLVLADFTNLYIEDKKRELIVLRINGFSMGDVRRYISGESVVTSIGGTCLGVAAGAGLSYLIIRLLEQPHIRLIRMVNPIALGIGAAVSLVLSLIIYFAAFGRVKKINMGDML